MGGVIRARLRNLGTGTVTERRFRADETIRVSVESNEYVERAKGEKR